MNQPLFFNLSGAGSKRSPCTEEAYAPGWMVRDSSVDKYPHPIDVKMRGTGREWPDFLSQSCSHSPLLCSQRVLDAIVKAGLTGYKAVSVRLHAPRGRKMNQPWNYYWLIPTAPPYAKKVKTFTGSEIERFREFLSYQRTDSLWVNRMLESPEEYVAVKKIPDPATWDGSDFNKFSAEVRCARFLDQQPRS